MKDLTELNDRYVTKGLSYDTGTKVGAYVQDFINLASTPTHNIKSHLDSSDKLKLTPIFLVGMLNLGPRLDEQFQFDNFVPSIISLLTENITDMEATNQYISIIIDKEEFDENRNNKFTTRLVYTRTGRCT